MNKKILIGSIIAVVILVLVSFTGVVGYQTTKSSTIVRASPLFSVRSSRAIDKESKDLTRDYVGKGEEIDILLPIKNSKAESLDRFLNIIRTMDDKSFDRFVKIVIANINQNNKINDVEVNDKEIAVMLSQLRDNSEVIKNNFMMIDDKEPTFVSIQPIPFCILLWIFVIPMAIIVQLFFMIPLRVLCLFIPIPGLPTFN
ncbi:MAG: hypothetical protein KAJ44_03280 [Thermoplasmatales archaeon]|nr:hypothetical protein [Thermoplasmatales archaeon]